jgi:multiple sugar transport system substrate-binding protein
MGIEQGGEFRRPRAVNRRHFLFGVTALAGGVLATACGTNIGNASPSGDSSGPSKGKAVLTQYYHEYGEAGTEEAVHRYAQQYMDKNPHVQINIEWIPGDYATKLSTALLGSNPPDIFEGSPSLQMVQEKQIAPLDDLYTSADRADFFSNVMEQNTIDGHIYGAKIVTDVGVLYYRKSMLEHAGVKPPENSDQLIGAARALTQGHVKGLFVGNDGGIGALYQLIPQSNRVQFIGGGKVVFATHAAAESLQVLAEVNHQNLVLLGYPEDYLQPDAFTNGATAMQWTGLWAMREVQQGVGDDFDVLPWPRYGSSGVPVTFLGGWSEMISPRSRYLDEAKDYVRWLWIQNTAAQEQFNLAYGFHLPPRKSIAARAKELQSGPAKKAVGYLGSDAYPISNSWDSDIDTTYGDAVSNIVHGNLDVGQSLTQLQQAQQRAQSELRQELT